MDENPPTTLGEAGKALWLKIVARYDLRSDELNTLEDVCAGEDMVALLRDQWIELGQPTVTKGSMGQEVIHPLIGEMRTQRQARNALWRQLKLPDEVASTVVNQNREAGQAKWAASHGKAR